MEIREQVLRLVREKYSGSEEERFGPTLAAEHLAQEDDVAVHPETLRRLRQGGIPLRQRRSAIIPGG